MVAGNVLAIFLSIASWVSGLLFAHVYYEQHIQKAKLLDCIQLGNVLLMLPSISKFMSRGGL